MITLFFEGWRNGNPQTSEVDHYHDFSIGEAGFNIDSPAIDGCFGFFALSFSQKD